MTEKLTRAELSERDRINACIALLDRESEQALDQLRDKLAYNEARS